MNSICQVKIEALVQAARERKSSSFLIAQGESLLCEDYLDWSDNPVALRVMPPIDWTLNLLN